MVINLIRDRFKLAEKEAAPAVTSEITVPGLREAIAQLRQSFPLLLEDSIARILGLPSEDRAAKPTTPATPISTEVPE
jgi:hypothetical protein